MAVFCTLDDQRMVEIIGSSEDRVIFAAPGIRLPLAQAIVNFTKRRGSANADVILDESSLVCRLGYGEIESVELLMNANIQVRKCTGIRAGVLIADDYAWFFTPLPLLLEDIPNLNTFAPNAIVIGQEQAREMIGALSPRLAVEGIINTSDDPHQRTLVKVPDPEIGYSEITPAELRAAQEDLKRIPPERFNLARQVRVYQSYVQFVELSLKGVALTRHTIQIPTELMNVQGNDAIQERLRSSYRLINETSNISGKQIYDRISKIRKDFCRSLGPRFGNVILRTKKEEFVGEVNKVRDELEAFREKAIDSLAGEFKKCKQDLLDLFMPGIQQNPPNELRLGIIYEIPTKDDVKQYILDKLDTCIPDPEDFVKEMQLICDFKDVTYETLNEGEFMDALKKAYPHQKWPDVPYDEFKAAAEMESR